MKIKKVNYLKEEQKPVEKPLKITHVLQETSGVWFKADYTPKGETITYLGPCYFRDDAESMFAVELSNGAVVLALGELNSGEYSF